MRMETQHHDNNTSETNEDTITKLQSEIEEYRTKIAEQNKERQFRGEIRNNFLSILKKISLFLIAGAFIISFLGKKIMEILPESITNGQKLSSGVIVSILFYLLVFVIIMFISLSKSSGDSYSKWKIQRLCIILFLVIIAISVILFNSMFNGGAA